MSKKQNDTQVRDRVVKTEDSFRTIIDAVKNAPDGDVRNLDKKTQDSFQNLAANLGVDVQNLMSASSYSFNPVSRIRTLMEFAHRGSWVVGQVVDIIAEDMTRAGATMTGDVDPEDMRKIEEYAEEIELWAGICNTIKWARLYGGCLGVHMVDGANVATPLNIDRIGKKQYRGILPLDMWTLQPDLTNMVTELGPNVGKPKFYKVFDPAPAYRGKSIHYTRGVRAIGIELPYWQATYENWWGISVVERLYDRLLAFDSTTQGAAQLVFKAHLRVMKINGLRQATAAGGQSVQGLAAQLRFMAQTQSNEGMSVLDMEDDFVATSYSFTGLSDVLLQFGQQISGATGIPLVRLFGQSPAGLNSTGESDLRMYYDGIASRQNLMLRKCVISAYRMIAASLGIKLPEGFGIKFNPLWLTSDKDKSEIAASTTDTVIKAEEAGIISPATAMKELKQSSDVTGVFTNISDEDISAMEDVPPQPEDVEVAEIKAEGAETSAEIKTAGGKDSALVADLERQIMELQNELSEKKVREYGG